MNNGIRDINIESDGDGRYSRVRIVFGPRYFVESSKGPEGKTNFILGATHHGFLADASEVGSELEKFICEIRAAHPICLKRPTRRLRNDLIWNRTPSLP